MKYMVIETFKPGQADAVYQRFEAWGRMLPEGLIYLNSWLSVDRTVCFQLMSTSDEKLFDQWTSRWNDLVDFQITPVNDSPTHLQQ